MHTARPEPSPADRARAHAELQAWRLARVQAAVLAVPAEGRFGPDKVFIIALWQQLGTEPGWCSLASFKRWLVEANMRTEITLVRADLVAAMDPATVAASEIRDLNSSFHFVIDRSRW